MRKALSDFLDAVSKFSSEVPIVVSYNKYNHELTYRQLNQTKIIPYLRPYYLPKKLFKIGILNNSGHVELMLGIKKLLEDIDLDKEGGSISFSIDKLSLKVYKTYRNINLVGPQLYIDLKFVNITNPILVWLIMRLHSIETRTLYKLLKNERKLKLTRKEQLDLIKEQEKVELLKNQSEHLENLNR